MNWWNSIGIQDLLAHQSGLRISVLTEEEICLEGMVSIHAQLSGSRAIEDDFQIRICIPSNFPKSLPQVFETAGRFKRSPDYHTYNDGSLCLGSEIRLRSLCADNPSVSAFFKNVIVPCLYSISHKLKYGDAPYGELEHGERGLVDDYEKLFGLKGRQAVLLAIKALGKRYREANKLQCPCGCSQRLGRCDFRFKLKPFRSLGKRQWFRDHIREHFHGVS